MKNASRIVSALSCALLLTAHALAADIRLSAAASLREVVDDLTEIYAGGHPGAMFFKNYGAAGMLAGQIASGAPASSFRTRICSRT